MYDVQNGPPLAGGVCAASELDSRHREGADAATTLGGNRSCGIKARTTLGPPWLELFSFRLLLKAL